MLEVGGSEFARTPRPGNRFCFRVVRACVRAGGWAGGREIREWMWGLIFEKNPTSPRHLSLFPFWIGRSSLFPGVDFHDFEASIGLGVKYPWNSVISQWDPMSSRRFQRVLLSSSEFLRVLMSSQWASVRFTEFHAGLSELQETVKEFQWVLNEFYWVLCEF